MIVCHCRQLTDSQLRRVIRDGADTLDDLGRACGAGVECGGCHPELNRLILVSTVRPFREGKMARLAGAAGVAANAVAANAVIAMAEAVGTGC